MPRLIDANALVEFAREGDKKTKAEGAHMLLTFLRNMVDLQPTIDAEPVRHGKWIEYPIADGMNQCSVCGVLRFGDSNYCPNCGARMDEHE